MTVAFHSFCWLVRSSDWLGLVLWTFTFENLPRSLLRLLILICIPSATQHVWASLKDSRIWLYTVNAIIADLPFVYIYIYLQILRLSILFLYFLFSNRWQFLGIITFRSDFNYWKVTRHSWSYYCCKLFRRCLNSDMLC